VHIAGAIRQLAGRVFKEDSEQCPMGCIHRARKNSSSRPGTCIVAGNFDPVPVKDASRTVVRCRVAKVPLTGKPGTCATAEATQTAGNDRKMYPNKQNGYADELSAHLVAESRSNRDSDSHGKPETWDCVLIAGIESPPFTTVTVSRPCACKSHRQSMHCLNQMQKTPFQMQ